MAADGDGIRYGMVGRNGVGKSTLLKGIAYGEIPMNTGLQVLVIEQEVPVCLRAACGLCIDESAVY